MTIDFAEEDLLWDIRESSREERVWKVMLGMCVTKEAEQSAKAFRARLKEKKMRLAGPEKSKVRRISNASSAGSVKSFERVSRAWKGFKGLVKARKEAIEGS